MKAIIFLIIGVLACSVTAQNVNLAKNQLSLNAFPTGLSFERKMNPTTSLKIGAGLVPLFYYPDLESYGDPSFTPPLLIVPIGYASFRKYYERKTIHRNNLKPNSGNYWGVFSSFQTASLLEPRNYLEYQAKAESMNVFTIGPVWGMQRNYQSGIHLGLSLGPGLMMGEYIPTQFVITGEFEFGFLIFTKE